MKKEFKEIKTVRDIIDLKSKDPERFKKFQKTAKKHTEDSYMPKEELIRFRESLNKVFKKILSSDMNEIDKRKEILNILTISLYALFLNIPDEDVAITIKGFLTNKKEIDGLYKELML